jgi:hypothetical protein
MVAEDLHEYLARRGVDPDDLAAIAAGPQRLGVYRSLVRNGLSTVVDQLLPRTRAHLNAANPGRFDRDLAAFVDAVGPRTHYLRDVPFEFFRWAERAWRVDASVPAHVADLASHELTAFDVATAEDDDPKSRFDPVTLGRRLILARSARLSRYAWAVHEIPVASPPTAPPARREVHLLGYRDSALDVRWLELTPLAAGVVAKLAEGEPLGVAVTAACAERGAHLDSDAIAGLLADLADRGVLMGAREGGSR